jgi:hypothetical protein
MEALNQVGLQDRRLASSFFTLDTFLPMSTAPERNSIV